MSSQNYLSTARLHALLLSGTSRFDEKVVILDIINIPLTIFYILPQIFAEISSAFSNSESTFMCIFFFFIYLPGSEKR